MTKNRKNYEQTLWLYRDWWWVRGIASINRAASYGKKCALIEAKQLGGTMRQCGLRYAQKVMWYGANMAAAIHHYAPDYGFDLDVKHFDFAKLVQSRCLYQPYSSVVQQWSEK